MSEGSVQTSAPKARLAAWREQVLRSSEQALEDLSVSQGSEVVFVRADGEAVASWYADAVEERARAQGFVTAQIGVATDRSFESLDALVRAVLNALRVPGARNARGHGIVDLLDTFAGRHGRRAPSLFDAQAEQEGAVGDLASLARAYISTAGQPRAEKKRLLAWLEGTELGHTEDAPLAISALTERTAKRALAQLTRVVRTLGHAGTLLLFRNGEMLLRLPAARRETAYTVLRELIDNADGGRGLVATRIALVGSTALFEGTRSLASLRPLASRVAVLARSSPVPPPHRPLIDLTVPPLFDATAPIPAPSTPNPSHAKELRGLIRACHGLPPIESILSMSVGQEAIDRTIDRLFQYAAMDGSVFALLTGDYGTGKTHLLLHLAARALAEQRPVFRLSLERLDTDLGNPQRHLRRVLDTAVLPARSRPTALDRLAAWTRSPESLGRLVRTLEELAADPGDAADAAQRALARSRNPKRRAAALEGFLGAVDLVDKPGGANYRQDAYRRLLLWVELLARLEGCGGPVVIIDEAENLYKMGVSRPERRTALRALSFYCGGALPRACVVMAITPDVLERLREESRELLEEVSEQTTLLASEDASMLRRRLSRLHPIDVPTLRPEHRALLLSRVFGTYARVRRQRPDAAWSHQSEALLGQSDLSPRELVRYATEWLESSWWSRKASK